MENFEKHVDEEHPPPSPGLPSFFLPFRMRRFAYCKVVLATSLVWVMLDMFILLYFSECNKCDNIKERGLPGREGERGNDLGARDLSLFLLSVCIHGRRPHQATGWTRRRRETCRYPEGEPGEDEGNVQDQPVQPHGLSDDRPQSIPA